MAHPCAIELKPYSLVVVFYETQALFYRKSISEAIFSAVLAPFN